MKNNFALLVLCTACLFTQSALAQNIQIVQTAADSLRDEGKLIEAIEEHKKIYLENPSDRTNVYNMACAYALLQNRDSAFHYVNIATANDSSVQALNDPDFYFLIEDERWTDLENSIVERVEAKWGQYEMPELSKELWRMKIKDQAFYYHLDVQEQCDGVQSPIQRALWELKAQINEKNEARVAEIIDEHGWPKASVVKGSAASTVFLIIQHSDIEMQKKYLPLMREAADAGEASWSSLALLIDRVNLREGGKQIYGSQISRDADGSFHVRDLDEPEYVNQRREEVGLGPIEEYVARWGIEWDIPQKTK